MTAQPVSFAANALRLAKRQSVDARPAARRPTMVEAITAPFGMLAPRRLDRAVIAASARQLARAAACHCSAAHERDRGGTRTRPLSAEEQGAVTATPADRSSRRCVAVGLPTANASITTLFKRLKKDGGLPRQPARCRPIDHAHAGPPAARRGSLSVVPMTYNTRFVVKMRCRRGPRASPKERRAARGLCIVSRPGAYLLPPPSLCGIPRRLLFGDCSWKSMS